MSYTSLILVILTLKFAFKLPKFLFNLIEPFQILLSKLNCLFSISNSQMGFKTGDLDLDGQIGLLTSKFCVISLNATSFEHFGI